MPRYIDADKYKELLKQSVDICYKSKDPFLDTEGKIFEKMIADLDEQPTADVQEVRHGKWVVEKALNGNFLCWCTNCGLGLRVKEKYIDLQNAEFCPRCGAKMDGDEK